MTPETQDQPRSLGAALGVLVCWYLLMTPAVMLAWNAGLVGAGIVSKGIGWITALGLAVVVTVLGNLLRANRRTIVVVEKEKDE